jgi:hypothetical protein
MLLLAAREALSPWRGATFEVVDLPMGRTLRIRTPMWTCDGSTVQVFVNATDDGQLRVSDAGSAHFLPASIGWPCKSWEDLADAYGVSNEGMAHQIVSPRDPGWTDALNRAVYAVACFTVATLAVSQHRGMPEERLAPPGTRMLERHAYGVVEVARVLAGVVTGSGSGNYQPNLDDLRDWLAWRTEEGWYPTTPGGSGDYDNAVRQMARAAVGMFDKERER